MREAARGIDRVVRTGIDAKSLTGVVAPILSVVFRHLHLWWLGRRRSTLDRSLYETRRRAVQDQLEALVRGPAPPYAGVVVAVPAGHVPQGVAHPFDPLRAPDLDEARQARTLDLLQGLEVRTGLAHLEGDSTRIVARERPGP